MKSAIAFMREIGPRCYLVCTPGHAPEVRHFDGTTEIATPSDMLLLGVLDWYARLDCSVARLWGRDCLVRLCVRTNGRYYAIAREAGGGFRILESVSAISMAEVIGADATISASEVPF